MDDCELVEFLLNDDFNKEKNLLNGPLDETSNNIDKNDNISKDDGNNKKKITQENLRGRNDLNSTKKENDDNEITITTGIRNVYKKEKDDNTDNLSSTESEFLDDLDNIIMSTNFTESSKRNKIKKDKTIKENNRRHKNDITTEDQSIQNESRSNIFASINESDLIVLNADAQSKIKLNDRTAVIKIQIFNNDTGKLDKETPFRIINADKLVLKTFKSKSNSKDGSEKSSKKCDNKSNNKPNSNNNNKLSFQFKLTASDMTPKKINTNNDTSQNTIKNNEYIDQKNKINQKDSKTKKRRDKKKNMKQSNKTSPKNMEQKKDRNNSSSHGTQRSSKERKNDRKQSDSTQSTLKRKIDDSTTKLREIMESKVPTDEYSRTTIEF
ncbi:Ska1p PWA37_003879 [Arxiozyma heterogenica]|uniref:Uncharacterized protein n=1 Tax=Arxiozyma heterogenica TaxID=278026 RepID=A0AAN8A5Y7_9SACH|nr:hypothetical protein RI543_004831 [Kazachstania heterogenica]